MPGTLMIIGASSSTRFVRCNADEPLMRGLYSVIERAGLRNRTLRFYLKPGMVGNRRRTMALPGRGTS